MFCGNKYYDLYCYYGTRVQAVSGFKREGGVGKLIKLAAAQEIM